jgi:O-acetyl-ADP-ribose deacetylase (regulator of RNase III)
LDPAAIIATTTVADFLDQNETIRQVIFACFSPHVETAFRAVLQRL